MEISIGISWILARHFIVAAFKIKCSSSEFTSFAYFDFEMSCNILFHNNIKSCIEN